jgi:hypothetical protein
MSSSLISAARRRSMHTAASRTVRTYCAEFRKQRTVWCASRLRLVMN